MARGTRRAEIGRDDETLTAGSGSGARLESELALSDTIVLEHLDKSQAEIVAEAFARQRPAPARVTIAQGADGMWSVTAVFDPVGEAPADDALVVVRASEDDFGLASGGPHGTGGGPDDELAGSAPEALAEGPHGPGGGPDDEVA